MNEPTSIKKNSRGIQPGQDVGAGAPRALERALQNAVKKVLVDPDVLAVVPEGYVFDWVQGVSREELHEILKNRNMSGLSEANQLVGYRPDGGIFLLKKGGHVTHLLSSEAKNQGKEGNAIERWFKNYMACTLVAPRIAIVVFASGEGAAKKEIIGRVTYTAFLHYAASNGGFIRSFDQGYLDGPSVFLKVAGFSVGEIVERIKPILIERLKNHTRS